MVARKKILAVTIKETHEILNRLLCLFLKAKDWYFIMSNLAPNDNFDVKML